MKKLLYVIGVIAVILVVVIFYFKADPVPQHIEDQFPDSAEVQDSAVETGFDDLNGEDFDFDFEEEEDSTDLESDTLI